MLWILVGFFPGTNKLISLVLLTYFHPCIFLVSLSNLGINGPPSLHRPFIGTSASSPTGCGILQYLHNMIKRVKITVTPTQWPRSLNQ